MRDKLTGAWGEALAAEYLRGKGCEILSMGYRCRFGEIDLIAKSGGYVVFAEVKTRKNNVFAEAREAVDGHKIGRIKATAEIWLAEHETELQPRFDVIEIYAPRGTATADPEIRHWEDAF